VKGGHAKLAREIKQDDTLEPLAWPPIELMEAEETPRGLASKPKCLIFSASVGLGDSPDLAWLASWPRGLDFARQGAAPGLGPTE
jgi:hypothetical protein